jgi:hypothetical protein
LCRGSNRGVRAAGGGRAQQRVDELDAARRDGDVGVVLGGGARDELDEAHGRDEALVLALAGGDVERFAASVVAAQRDALALDVDHHDALRAEEPDIDLVLVAVREGRGP